jgi:hypothetical protein
MWFHDPGRWNAYTERGQDLRRRGPFWPISLVVLVGILLVVLPLKLFRFVARSFARILGRGAAPTP